MALFIVQLSCWIDDTECIHSQIQSSPILGVCHHSSECLLPVSWSTIVRRQGWSSDEPLIGSQLLISPITVREKSECVRVYTIYRPICTRPLSVVQFTDTCIGEAWTPLFLCSTCNVYALPYLEMKPLFRETEFEMESTVKITPVWTERCRLRNSSGGWLQGGFDVLHSSSIICPLCASVCGCKQRQLVSGH